MLMVFAAASSALRLGMTGGSAVKSGVRRSCYGRPASRRPQFLRRPSRWLQRLIDLAFEPVHRVLEESRIRRAIRLMPKRIVLIRHGESQGNVDRNLYSRVPDSLIELTATGYEQGAACGRLLRGLVGNGSVHFYYSPYMRTRQTLMSLLKSFHGMKLPVTCEPRLREQDFGNFQNSTRMARIFEDRQRFGRFYFRFPNGEAGTDVYDRVNDYWQDLMARPEQRGTSSPAARADNVESVVLVTHGLLMRTFCSETSGT
jgi:broad specificity phosphatase PhoE